MTTLQHLKKKDIVTTICDGFKTAISNAANDRAETICSALKAAWKIG